MSLADYSSLKTTIASFLDDAGIDAYIPDMVTLAEARINRVLRTREMQKRATATMDTASRFLACPASFAEMISLRLNSTQLAGVSYISNAQIDDFYNQAAGRPEYYTIWGDELEFNRLSDSAYEIEMKYYKKVAALSDSNTTNDVLTYYPDIYLYGALVSAEAFIMEDTRLPMWKSLFEQMVYEANREATKSRVSGSELRARVRGSTP